MKTHSTKFSWFIPIDGDGYHAGTEFPEREPSFEYLSQVVKTAEKHDFYSLLIPTRFANGLFLEESPLAETWTTATALAAVTQKIRFLIAVRPGFIPVGLFAQMAGALHQISNGRIDINIVPGGIQNDFERLGQYIDHDVRYERAVEFIQACQTLWNEDGPIEFDGDFYKLNNAYCSPRPKQSPPLFYLGGASPRAIDMSGKLADIHLNWIEPIGPFTELINKLKESFIANNREPRFGLRTHLIVRNTEEEAWKAADELISLAAPKVKAQRNTSIQGTAMVGQIAQSQRVKDHKVSDHLWNGLSEVRVNCGTAIVGTPETVAEELTKYKALGIEEFILSGFPHVEECIRVAEEVIPLID